MGAEQSAPAVPEGQPTVTIPPGPSPQESRQEYSERMETNPTMPCALVVVGPSGVGKGTLIKRIMEGSDQFGFSISHTTRQPRPGEQVWARQFSDSYMHDGHAGVWCSLISQIRHLS